MHDTERQSAPVVPGGKPASDLPVHVLRPLRRWAAVSWAGWLLSIGLLGWQHWMRVVHPPWLLFIFVVVFRFGSARASVVMWLGRWLRWELRRGGLAWMLGVFRQGELRQ